MTLPNTRQETIEARRRLKAEYPILFDKIAALLFRYDPIRISFEVNPNEYETEAATILPRLQNCQSAGDVQRVVHEEFVRWFDGSIAGQEKDYRDIASEIWQMWQEHQRRNGKILLEPLSE